MGVALDDVVKGVARAADGAGARQRQVFNIMAQREVDGRFNLINAPIFTSLFGDRIARIIHDIKVGPCPTRQTVSPRAAIQLIVAVATGEGVIAAEAEHFCVFV